MSESSRSLPSARTFYDEVGGAPTFTRLVAHFYAGVARPIRSSARSTRRTTGRAPRSGCAAFLEQYWGGPTTYSQQRGHPRLRMRHAPFAIGDDRARRLAQPHARRRRLARPHPRAGRARSGATWRWPRAACRTAARRRRRRPLPPSHPHPTLPRSPVTPRRRPRALPRTGGGTRSSTRSTSAASPTGTATASVTSPASAAGCRYLADLGVRRALDHAVLSLADGRPRLRRRRSARRRAGVRRPRRVRRAARRRPRARHPGDHRPGAQPQLAPARVVPGGAGRRPRIAGAGALRVPRRPRSRRQRAAQQLAVGLRRARLDPGAGRPVVPAPVRAGAAGPGLHQPRGRRRPRGDDAVLARPRRRRLPHRRRARDGQARRAAGHAADGRHRPARRPRPRRPPLRPRRRARGAPPDPDGARRVPRHDGRRRGLGVRRRPAGPLPPRRTSCIWRSTSSC